MQPWRQYIYIMEVVLVAIPVVPFMFFTGVALGMLATEETIVALKILPFWFGSCLGTFALWSMCVRIYQFRSIRTLKELPYATLGYGIFSNTMLIFYLDMFRKMEPEHIVLSLIMLSPTLVAIHWIFVLFKIEKPLALNKMKPNDHDRDDII